mmetsp:Transcript_17568/g.34041  ORF Transcript_17568/g.34041 Transcript_17568/m.34041 type:complete len:86 (+) Transcript_17568:273-530(+)
MNGHVCCGCPLISEHSLSPGNVATTMAQTCAGKKMQESQSCECRIAYTDTEDVLRSRRISKELRDIGMLQLDKRLRPHTICLGRI